MKVKWLDARRLLCESVGGGGGLTKRSAGLGLESLPRGFAPRGPLRCAPRCRARTPLRGTRRPPVVDQPPIGDFGLARELAFGVEDGLGLAAGDSVTSLLRRR